MYKTVKGNLVTAALNGEIAFMLHVVNCKGVMGSGIAKEVKERSPETFEAYIDKINMHAPNSTLGMISGSYERLDVVNLHAQENFGTGKRFINYTALIKCLQEVVKLITLTCTAINYKEKLAVGIPYKMGSDRAGGDWDTVLEIVDAILGDVCDLYVYQLD